MPSVFQSDGFVILGSVQVVSTLLIGEISSVCSDFCATEPPWIGYLVEFLFSCAYAFLLSSVLTSLTIVLGAFYFRSDHLDITYPIVLMFLGLVCFILEVLFYVPMYSFQMELIGDQCRTGGTTSSVRLFSNLDIPSGHYAHYYANFTHGVFVAKAVPTYTILGIALPVLLITILMNAAHTRGFRSAMLSARRMKSDKDGESDLTT